MTLRTKTLLIIGITLLGLIVLLYASSQSILLASFVQLENDSVHSSTRRAMLTISNEISQLTTTTQDWAYWDDTYEFVQDPNDEYIESNLVDSTFLMSSLNVILFINISGDIVYGQAFDLNTKMPAHVPESLKDLLSTDSLLLQHTSTSSVLSGIIMLPDTGPLMIASLPILTSNQEGPIQGTIIFGRYLDYSAIQRLAVTSQLLLSAYRYNDAPLPADIQEARNHLSSQKPTFIHALDNQSIAGYGLLRDIYGNPVMILKVDMSRNIYEQGRASLWYFMLALLSAGVVFGTMIMLLLEQTVLSRLGRLSVSVNQIGQSSDASQRVFIGGHDELSNLANAVNSMLEALELSQKSVLASEERLRTVISNSPIILYALDTQGVITLLEGRGLGDIDPQKFMGRPISDLLGNSVIQGVQQNLAGDRFVTFVEVSGQVFETHQLPLKTPDDTIIGVIGVATDITERKRAEIAEHEQRVMAEALRDTAAALTGTLNLDEVLERILTNVEHVVPHDATNIMLIESGIASVVRHRGYVERGLGQWISILRFLVEDVPDLQQMIDKNHRFLIIPDTQSHSGWLNFPETQWVRSCISAPICLEGRVIGVLNLDSATPGFFTAKHAAWLQAFADQAALAIHNAQIYEAERHERLFAQTLRKTAEVLASSINLEDTLNLIVEQLGQVVHYNRATVLLVEGDYLQVAGARGFSEEDDIYQQSFHYPTLPLFRDAMLAGEPIVLADVQSDSRWDEMTGLQRHTRSWIGTPLTAREVVIGFLTISSDAVNAYTRRDVEAVAAFAQQAALAVENTRILTELETSLNELREAQGQLVRTARLSAAGEIAAGVAHQINNPLTTVIAEAYLLLQELDPENPNYESVEAIREAANRAGEVVRRLLDLTRSHPYIMHPLDINASLQNSIALIRAQIVPHIAQLEVDLAADLPMVNASAQHLEDVWINLLLNARDAVSDSDGGVLRVTSAVTADGRAIQVTFEDNGQGIQPEDLTRIFEPFFTTKEYGNGLGLSICQEVITRHGGEIQIESTVGQGTVFTVILPVNGYIK